MYKNIYKNNMAYQVEYGININIFICLYLVNHYTLKNAGLFQPNFGSNMD